MALVKYRYEIDAKQLEISEADEHYEVFQQNGSSRYLNLISPEIVIYIEDVDM